LRIASKIYDSLFTVKSSRPTRAYSAESLVLLRHALWEQEQGAINYRAASHTS
jgi:hypothetical protein